MPLKTITANEFRASADHTGPVYHGVGALPYTAALNGVELKGKGLGRRVRLFKTAEAAERAINGVRPL